MASILETFILKFATDNTDLDKGAKGVKDTTNKLADSLNNVDDVGKKLQGGLASLIKQYGGVIAAALSFNAILKGVRQANDYAYSLGFLAEQTGAAVEELDAWSSAVQKWGGSSESFGNSIKNLSVELSKFVTTGGSSVAPFFQLLNVRMTDGHNNARKMLDILPDLADAFKKLTPPKALEYGRGLGFDDRTIALLQQGSKELDRVIARQKELGVVTKQDVEAANKFNYAWAEMQHAFRGLFLAVGTTVIPALTWIIEKFTTVAQFFKENSKFITGVLIALGVAIATFLLPPLLTAAAAALVLYAPFLLIGAAVAALSLAFGVLYDDIMNFFEGNKSVTGEILKKWPIVGEIIKQIVLAFKNLWAIVKLVFNFIRDGIDGLIDSVSSFINTLRTVAGFVKSLFGNKDTTISLEKSQDILNRVAFNPLGLVTSNSISNSKTSASNSDNSVSTGPVTINTQATDAEGIAKEFNKSLQQQMRQAGSSFDDGVMA